MRHALWTSILLCITSSVTYSMQSSSQPTPQDAYTTHSKKIGVWNIHSALRGRTKSLTTDNYPSLNVPFSIVTTLQMWTVYFLALYVRNHVDFERHMRNEQQACLTCACMHYHFWFYGLQACIPLAPIPMILFVSLGDTVFSRLKSHLQTLRAYRASDNVLRLYDAHDALKSIPRGARALVRGPKTSAPEMCSICREDMHSATQGATAALNCSHTFHASCIGQWREQKPDCPVCRKRSPYMLTLDKS